MPSVSRRRALVGSVVLPASVAFGCAANADPGDVAPRNLLGIGPNGRIRGVNIGPSGLDWGGDSPWSELWRRWDWDGQIKNEVDDAVAVGANCVRIFGNTHVVSSGAITMDTYQQQWRQFLDYAGSRGMMVYPCGGDLSHWGNTTLSAAEDQYHDWAETLAGYDHIIGVDITNEAPAQSRVSGGIAYYQPESWFYTVRRLGEIVRSVAKKPITHSRGLYTYDAASWQFGSPETDKISDFLDVHAYKFNSPNDADPLYSADWGVGKQLIIGEFGVNKTLDSAARRDAYVNTKHFIEHSSNCVGGLAWTIHDLGSTPDSQFGLVDENRAPREDIAGPFSDLPLSR